MSAVLPAPLNATARTCVYTERVASSAKTLYATRSTSASGWSPAGSAYRGETPAQSAKRPSITRGVGAGVVVKRAARSGARTIRRTTAAMPTVDRAHSRPLRGSGLARPPRRPFVNPFPFTSPFVRPPPRAGPPRTPFPRPRPLPGAAAAQARVHGEEPVIDREGPQGGDGPRGRGQRRRRLHREWQDPGGVFLRLGGLG